MAPRSALALVLVAMALGAIVYFLEVRGGAGGGSGDGESRMLLPGISAALIDSIQLTTTDGHEVAVERAAGRWELVEPVRFPGDAVTLDGMAATVAQLAWDEEVDRPEARDVYGLDVAERRISFAAGSEQWELWIGRSAPADGKTYVALGADPSAPVYTVDTWRTSSLQRALDDLRDRRVLAFDRTAVDRVEVRWPGGRVLMSRSEGEWMLETPVVGPADRATLEDLLSDLAFMRAEGFVDDPPPEALEELREPDFAVTLSGPANDLDADVESERFEVGFTLGGFATRQLRYVRGTDPRALYLLPAERTAELPRSVADYRSHVLSRFDADEAYGLELVYAPGPRTVYATRTDEGWQIGGVPVDDDGVAALVIELAKLRASGIVAERMGEGELAALGLAPPRLSVRVYGAYPEEGPAVKLAAFELGRADSERGAFAMRADGPLVYTIDPEVASRLPLDPDEFGADPAAASD